MSSGSELDGTAVRAVHQTGLVRVLAEEPAGLSGVLARSAPPG